MSERAHSYLSSKCQVQSTDNRGGHTVVAREAIAKGELIAIWSGILVQSSELDLLPITVRRYSLQVEEDQYLVSLSDCEPADYVNHSCCPNAGLSGQIALVAMREIRIGEEVTYDYAMSDGSSYDEFKCGCGSENCRISISGYDWQNPELWVRYEGHFSPYLQRRIDGIKSTSLCRQRIRSRTQAKLSVATVTTSG